MSVRKCQCGRPSKVYAMDPIPGGWGDYYCYVCKPSGWITEVLYQAHEDDWEVTK